MPGRGVQVGAEVGAAGPTPGEERHRSPPIWGNGFSRFKK